MIIEKVEGYRLDREGDRTFPRFFERQEDAEFTKKFFHRPSVTMKPLIVATNPSS